MVATFELNQNEINESFLSMLRQLAKGSRLKVTVETGSESVDETAYLLSTEANQAVLQDSIHATEEYSFSSDEFDTFSKALLTDSPIDIEAYKRPVRQ